MTAFVENIDQTKEALWEREGKYLTFSLGEEEYGIGILKTKEIIRMMSITSVPRFPNTSYDLTTNGLEKHIIDKRRKKCSKT